MNFTKLSYIKDDPQTHLTLTTDASDIGVGAVVEQECDSTQTYCILFSQAVTCTEKVQYLSTRVAGHILGSQTFQTSGRDFTIYTDHKPLTKQWELTLTNIRLRKSDVSITSQFSTNICHVKGKDNTVADTLSQTEIHVLKKDVLSQDLITKEQKSDSTLREVQEFPVPLSDGRLYCDISQANPKPYPQPGITKSISAPTWIVTHK